MPGDHKHVPETAMQGVPSGYSAAEAVRLAGEEEEKGFFDRRVDLALSLCVTALGIFLVYASYGIRRGSIPDPIGSGGWARVLGVAVMIAGGVLVFRRLMSWRGETGNLVPSDGGKDGEPGVPSSNLRPFLVLAGGFAWVYALPRLGFLVPTYTLTVIVLFLMRVRSPAKLFLLPGIFALAIWIFFGNVLGIRFPVGPLERILQGFLAALF